MTPAEAFRWFREARDVMIAVVALFMLVYETVVVTTPNALIVGAGLTLLGLPAAFRLDQLFRTNGNGTNGERKP